MAQFLRCLLSDIVEITQLNLNHFLGCQSAFASGNKIFLIQLVEHWTVNDVIADKNVVTKIMNNSTGLQRIELNGFAKRHL